jgi:DNA-binding NarL/FixJ family response regulator
MLNGIEAARKLTAAGTRAKIVFLTVHTDEDYVRAAQQAGGLGYVVKSQLASDLAPAVREALAGRPFVSPSISS